MPNSYFQFKRFCIHQDRCAMRVTTDACILGAWAPVAPEGRFLDIGTGTGLLALMIAQRSNGTIDAIDLDEESCDQAKENIAASNWHDRITLLREDIVKFAGEDGHALYDFIICNPPFFARQLLSSSSKKNIARHDGSLKAAELLKAATKLLKKDEGKFAVLLPSRQSKDFISEARKQNLFLHQELLIKSNSKKAAIRCVMVFAFTAPEKVEHQLLSIKDENGGYTMQFKLLMKDFYLRLD